MVVSHDELLPVIRDQGAQPFVNENSFYTGLHFALAEKFDLGGAGQDSLAHNGNFFFFAFAFFAQSTGVDKRQEKADDEEELRPETNAQEQEFFPSTVNSFAACRWRPPPSLDSLTGTFESPARSAGRLVRISI